MLKQKWLIFALMVSFILNLSCEKKDNNMSLKQRLDKVDLIILDPGHFHAGLVQKVMYPQVSPVVHVYAPDGPDVQDYLKRIDGYNKREKDPTHWETRLYKGDDFLEKMTDERSGNMIVISGNNRKKTEYIKTAVQSGFHVLSDKPMCINDQDFQTLRQVFTLAEKNEVILYDIMTERYEITSIIQKVLVNDPQVFGKMMIGTKEDPAVIKESVHHYFKYVSGNPIKRPGWYFDVHQQGEGIVDVTTHLVDLVQWSCFPEQIIDYNKDIQMLEGKRWPTRIDPDQFKKVTGLTAYPDYLDPYLTDKNIIEVYANGAMIYRLKDIYIKVSVKWNFEAPPGGGDTHYSIARGSKADIIIIQNEEQNFRPELFVKIKEPSVESALKQVVGNIQTSYPGIELQKNVDRWQVMIPDKYRLGHEAHFAQVMEKYLGYLTNNNLPAWEVPNMIAKYYTTTSAYKMTVK
jgi:predicted dehydrogenase